MPLTVPLVNVRFAVERLVLTGTIGESIGSRILAAAKTLHYTQRTYRTILAEAGLDGRHDAADVRSMLGLTM